MANYLKIKSGLAQLKVKDFIVFVCIVYFRVWTVQKFYVLVSDTYYKFNYAGLPVYFIEPHHPNKFFWRGEFYGEHDDFKRFSFFSRAALELLLQAGKKPDIIHCHDWQTAFVVWSI